MRIILMGPPGAGKGTQAEIISARLGVPHISSGAIFRAHMAAGTPLGVQAREYIDRGDYVPDEVTTGMIRARLYEADAERGFLLDGYPRTIDQIHHLDEILAGHDHVIDHVILLTADIEPMVERLLARAQIEGRSDDTAEIIRNRMSVYEAKTEPLARVYEERGLLRRISALGDIPEVTSRILEVLGTV